ncbi:MAG: GGDEF domain-containing protein [Thermoguttaceae bacterium]
MLIADLWTIPMPVPLALAIVATIGYVFGCRRSLARGDVANRSRRELRRAQMVAAELEKIAWDLRKNLAAHHASVSKFRERVGRLGADNDDAPWKELCRETEEILKPTLRLAAKVASAYDELRQQSANLMTFTEVRTDPLTGVNNRRGLDDTLSIQLAMKNRYQVPFAVAMFDIDHFKAVNDKEGHVYGDTVLRNLARVFDEVLRETDVLARYGGEEFVVVMPQTELDGASILAERLRAHVEQKLDITVSAGVAMSHDGDTQDSLIARADDALYTAKTAGRNCVFRHNGEKCESIFDSRPLEPAVAGVLVAEHGEAAPADGQPS